MQFQKPSINSNFDKTLSQRLDPVKEESPALVSSTNMTISSPSSKINTPTHAIQSSSPVNIPTKEEMKMYLFVIYII